MCSSQTGVGDTQTPQGHEKYLRRTQDSEIVTKGGGDELNQWLSFQMS